MEHGELQPPGCVAAAAPSTWTAYLPPAASRWVVRPMPSLDDGWQPDPCASHGALSVWSPAVHRGPPALAGACILPPGRRKKLDCGADIVNWGWGGREDNKLLGLRSR